MQPSILQGFFLAVFQFSRVVSNIFCIPVLRFSVISHLVQYLKLLFQLLQGLQPSTGVKSTSSGSVQIQRAEEGFQNKPESGWMDFVVKTKKKHKIHLVSFL